MAQPKEPPISFRPEPELLERLDAYVARERSNRNHAMKRLLRVALDAAGIPVPLAVGDLVFSEGLSTILTIIALDGGWAWLRDREDSRIQVPISDLTRAV